MVLQVETTKEFYRHLRLDEQNSREWYQLATGLAETAGVQPILPRVVSRMTQRPNTITSGRVDDYYHLNIYLPFLDHLIMELDTQFTGDLHVYGIHSFTCRY